MEPIEPNHPEWVVCMDFGRPEMMIVPILAFLSTLVKGLSGMGEALVYGAGWQLFYIAGYKEMENLGLLAGLVCVMQCNSTALLAFRNWQQWWFYAKPGMIFSFAMLALSPVGNHVREVAPTESVQLVLAVTFLSFALLKPLFDGILAVMKTKEVSSRPPSEGLDTAPSTEPIEPAEATVETEVIEPTDATDTTIAMEAKSRSEFSQLPEAPSWLRPVLVPVGMVGGFLGGLCGMNGPPFILLTALTGLDKVVAHNLFPMGQAMEVWTFRLPMLLYLQRIRLQDAHIYIVGLIAGTVGLQLGNFLAPKVSQKVFERSMLLFLVVSSLLVLGLLQGRPPALAALGITILILLLRLLTARHERMSRRWSTA